MGGTPVAGRASGIDGDGLARQRLDKPYIRKNGKLQPATWPEAFAAIAEPALVVLLALKDLIVGRAPTPR